ncbi:MAG: flagellar hook-associated protein FlgL [Acidimicrobiia bacterium]|nr:flagellar hook-associated protein FlgL [Acidimicrobiia bacterium]
MTTTSTGRMMLANINASARTLAQAQERSASGKAVQRPSDGPAQVLSALDYRSQLRRNEQLGRNALDARSWLDTADSALMHTVERVTRARTLVVGAVNASSDSQAREAYAAEIDAIREGLIQTANTQHLGRPIFSGTDDVTNSYDDSGAYQGNSGEVQRTVAPGVTIRVNRTGPEVFGSQDPAVNPDGDLFQVLADISTALRAGDIEAASSGITKLTAATDRIETAQVEMGARSKQVEEIGFRNMDVDIALKSALSEVEDVDMAEALIEVHVQEMAYQAALSVAAKVIQPTLLDFLR